MASKQVERRNALARAEGYRNYYEKRLAQANRKFGGNISRAQARGHAKQGEAPLSKIQQVKEVLNKDGRKAAFDFAEENDFEFSHQQWSIILGSPTLRSRK